ncbi:LytR/AlgR family response regulator transcription factor [Spirosoma utsteinense]|uniref:DNA-binding LytR/AlgR family response regulator n=1 Tax=Spirosoma utsteinense TaxID=2585773 RepID=A0ABR6WD88_9BACT|nr:LytTR family DNA-binding domain-containing protein [Spirosoma utsteinense]MBC3788417.1 DNA-binding LytR/AlgR family response regulator [Spirosoma utsteinense]MBC3794492.1 DNA-binding LytR/AlgR family response regulator [Spirosoma utsteinense]
MNLASTDPILIVEDNLADAFWLKQAVEMMGFQSPLLTHTTDMAQQLIVQQQPRLIICDLFLDSKPKGLSLLQQFADRGRQFIMVTHSDEYSLYEQTRAMGVGGHLVKPFHPLTLRSIMDQALRELPPAPVVKLPCLFIRGAQNQRMRIEFSDILYIYSERNYIFIRTRESRFTLKRSLSKLMEELDSRFVRVHNSYVINTDYLKSMATTTLLIDKEIIPLGRAYRKNLVSRMKPVTREVYA